MTKVRLSGLFLCHLPAVIALLFCAGCLQEKETPLNWADFLEILADMDHVARLDTPGASLIASSDPADGEDDADPLPRKGARGWVTLADLRGPGVATRLWITGVSDGTQRVRFYFDGAWRPTVELTLDELTGGREPFVAPLAAYESDGWYSLVPMPYRRRLVIKIEERRGRAAAPGGRLSWQVNYTKLPRETLLRSFDGTVTENERVALKNLAAAWNAFDRRDAAPGARVAFGSLALQPGERRWMDPIRGPGVIRRLKITPNFEAVESAIERQNLSRDVVLNIRWDKAPAPSVAVPLGDFFGSMWYPVRFRSAFFGLSGGTWVCDFPMPFSREAEIMLENQGITPIEIEVEAIWEPTPARHEQAGYFHAAWSGSVPEDIGRPHLVLDARGRGKFVGCVVGVCSMDRDWRILHGGEWIVVDGESAPRLRGTALNHYFSAGRTFQGPIARPLHGTVFRTFFGSVQYRLHATDAVTFDRSLQMFLDRGPYHESRSWMQSVAFYYMDRPMAVSAAASKPPVRRPLPAHPGAEAAIMTELLNYERLGDYPGAREHIARYIERFPSSRYVAVLRLRQIAYTEAISGFDAAWPRYQQFLAEETDGVALAQARLLAWFLENPEHALLGLHGSARAEAILNGTTLCTVDGPERAAVVGVRIKPGRHCLAVQSVGQPRPYWVQACLKMRKGVVATQAGWKYSFEAGGDWGVPGYDDRKWKTLLRTDTIAPPEAPFIWMEPHAFVGLQSAPAGLSPSDREGPEQQDTVVFRREFDAR